MTPADPPGAPPPSGGVPRTFVGDAASAGERSGVDRVRRSTTLVRRRRRRRGGSSRGGASRCSSLLIVVPRPQGPAAVRVRVPDRVHPRAGRALDDRAQGRHAPDAARARDHHLLPRVHRGGGRASCSCSCRGCRATSRASARRRRRSTSRSTRSGRPQLARWLEKRFPSLAGRAGGARGAGDRPRRAAAAGHRVHADAAARRAVRVPARAERRSTSSRSPTAAFTLHTQRGAARAADARGQAPHVRQEGHGRAAVASSTTWCGSASRWSTGVHHAASSCSSSR